MILINKIVRYIVDLKKVIRLVIMIKDGKYIVYFIYSFVLVNFLFCGGEYN